MIWFGDIKFDTHQNHYNLFCRCFTWYVYDAAQVIAAKIAKKPFDGVDRAKSACNYVAKARRTRCAKY